MTSNASLGFADSINQVEKSVDYAIDLGLSGYILTDHEMLGGQARLLKYRDELEAEGKISHETFRIGLGNEIYLVREDGPQKKYYHHLLIAKDAKGHEILRKMSTQAWKNSFVDRGIKRTPITWAQVEQIMQEEKGKGHVISSTACIGSTEAQAFLRMKATEEGTANYDLDKEKQNIIDFVFWNKNVFGEDNFFLEIAPNVSEEQRYVNRRTWALGEATNTPVLFSTDSHYLSEDDRAVHRAYLNSKQAEREVDDFYYTAYMMGHDKVKEYFMLDFTEEQFNIMLDNLSRIRNSLEHYTLFQEQQIPLVDVVVPELSSYWESYEFEKNYPDIDLMLKSGHEQTLYWVRTCLNELQARNLLGEVYLKQINIEAHTLNEISNKLGQDMTGYYNLAQRLVSIMWNEGDSLVGVSRGSAFGFLSNYLLDITQMDPIPYVGDMSWRHLSKDRPELADVDLDSQGSKREQVIEAFKNYFGYDKVLNVATFGTEKTRKALATAARGLGISDDVSTYLSGLIVNERGFDRSISDTYYGNESKGFVPNKAFISEIDKYPLYLDTALQIEGIISSLGSHASAIYIFNDPYTSMNAMMKTPNGLEVTQWDYRDSDSMGALKMDCLSINGLDKIRQTMDLLVNDGLMEWQGSLKATYDKYLHPDVLDYSEEMFKPAWEGEVLDLFQFDTPVGSHAIQYGKPRTLTEMSSLNSLMRLMAPSGQESPIDRFVRMKNNIQLWYDELKKYNIPEEEISILEKHYLPANGCISTQEEMMLILMDEKLCNFTEVEANKARKLVGKKQMEKIPGLKEKIFSQSICSPETVSYIWKTAIEPSLGYGFSILHSICYSALGLQELNLYNHYPPVYWNTGCLIVNSGDLEASSTDYSKIALAIGATLKNGIDVSLVDINKSDILFTPDSKNNSITYGFRSLTGIGYDFIEKIMEHRPFVSLEDFLEKTKPNKAQAVNLIKAGAFMNIDSQNRKITMFKYVKSITPKRKNLTIAQIPALVQHGLLDLEEYGSEYKVYEFNRYLKTLKKDKENFYVDNRAITFLDSLGEEDLYIQDGDSYLLNKKLWAKTYDRYMDNIRSFFSNNKEFLIEKLTELEVFDNFNEIAPGSIAQWEMDSMSFYRTKHELKEVDYSEYGIVAFNSLPSEAEKVASGRWFRNKTNSIIGTIINKNKTKGSIHILTPEGDVVLVKMYKEQFSHYDKQISRRLPDGKKQVIEKSWLTRGQKIFLHGFRRDDQFVPRVYGGSPYPAVALITSLNEKDGTFSLKVERESE